MRFMLLGPVEVRFSDGRVAVLRPRQRALLAYLLLSANQLVTTYRLVDAIWGDTPPATATAQIHADISAIRRAFRVAGAQDRVVTEYSGYRVLAGPNELDLAEFSTVTDAAREAAERPSEAASLLHRALGLWRGPALEDVGAAYADVAQASLEERRMAAYEEWADIELLLGHETDLVVELAPLVRAHSARERLCGQLMTALYRTGRQADALQVARQLRRHLADHYGLDPGLFIQRLEQMILRADPALQPPEAKLQIGGTAVPERPVPAQLPATVGDFVGRGEQIARLDALLSEDRVNGTTLVISAIAGAGGVGKTALAVSWASRVAHLFPDGQFFVNLQGFGPVKPVRPVDALGGILRAVGVPANDVPVDEDEAAALYRTQLAGRRALIVLDNAITAEQVRPLLPGDPSCVVVVTSRHRLGGLSVTHGARRLTLDVLAEPEGLDLLSAIIGIERISAEPNAAAELARLCGYLPLALRIAAAQLLDHPDQMIGRYVAEMVAGGTLGTLIIDDDPQSSVRATLDASYIQLSEPERYTFRLIGLLPGPDISVEGAAAFTDRSLSQAAAILARLAASHLLETATEGRYAMHDLVREYAAEHVDGDGAPGERAAALDRLLDWYLRTVHAAVDLLRPDTLRLPHDRIEDRASPSPRFNDRDQALLWLDTERHNLVAAVAAAADHGPLAAGWLLADATRAYFYLRPLVVDWLTVATAGLAAARAGGDLHGEAAAELSLGDAEHSGGRYPAAIGHYRRALECTRAADWSTGEATVLNNLGMVFQRIGQPAEAAEHYGRALALRRLHNDISGQAGPLLNLGSAEYELGLLNKTAEHYSQAVKLFQVIDSRQGLSVALGNLGELCHHLGRIAEAREHLNRALAVTRELTDQLIEAETLRMLACVNRDTGRLDRALECARAALRITQGTSDQRYEPGILNTLGTVLSRLDRPVEAVNHHQHALERARESRASTPEVEALIGLADAHLELRDIRQAHTYANEALGRIRRSGLRLFEGLALTSLAAIHLQDGEIRLATDAAGAAVTMHRETGHQLGEAAALAILARSGL